MVIETKNAPKPQAPIETNKSYLPNSVTPLEHGDYGTDVEGATVHILGDVENSRAEILATIGRDALDLVNDSAPFLRMIKADIVPNENNSQITIHFRNGPESDSLTFNTQDSNWRNDLRKEAENMVPSGL